MIGSAQRPASRAASLAVAVLYLTVWSGSAAAGAVQRTLLTRATLIDGTGAPAVPESWIVIEGNRITGVGTGPPPIEPADEVIDLSGKAILPGLADMHFHLLGKETAPWQMKFALAHGVTVVRDVGVGTAYIDVPDDEARWSHDGLGDVPPDERVYWTARYAWDKIEGLRRWLGQEELTPHFYTAGVMLYGSARQKRLLLPGDGIRALVAGNLAVGVDFIKVHQWTSSAALTQAVELARENGLRVVGHVPTGMSSVAAIDAGVRTLEHVRLRPWEVLDDPVLVARYPVDGTWPMRDSFWAHFDPGGKVLARTLDTWELRKEAFFLDPTLVEWQWETCDYPKADHPVIDRLPAAWQDRYRNCTQHPDTGQIRHIRATLDGVSRFVGLAHRRGIRILAGTDIPEIPGASLHRELELLVRAGLSPVEAIRAATGHAAEELGTPDRGTIETGKVADLIIIAGNPAEDISAVSNVETVVLGGQFHQRGVLLEQAASLAAKTEKTR